MSKHSVVHWSMPRDSRKRAEVAAEQAIARYGTPSAASEATGIPLDVLEAPEARINEAVGDVSTAALLWPVVDPDIRWYRALGEATLDLPRIMAENHWQQAGEPSGWRFDEGIDTTGRALFLRCEVDVLVVPRGCREAG